MQAPASKNLDMMMMDDGLDKLEAIDEKEEESVSKKSTGFFAGIANFFGGSKESKTKALPPK